MTYTQEEWIQILRFKEWWDLNSPKLVIEPESTVYSIRTFRAGTLDFVVELPEEVNVGLKKPQKIEPGVYVGDLKTGKAIYKKNYVQVADYAYMAMEMFDLDIQGTFILHTNADTKSGFRMWIRNREEMEADYALMKHYHELWLSESPPKPKVFDMPTKLKLGGE
jgi:CRISPR/Cas system-associated exonuclease Cas4 (RecB family)